MTLNQQRKAALEAAGLVELRIFVDKDKASKIKAKYDKKHLVKRKQRSDKNLGQ